MIKATKIMVITADTRDSRYFAVQYNTIVHKVHNNLAGKISVTLRTPENELFGERLSAL